MHGWFVQIGVQNMNDGILVVPDNAVKPQQVRNMGLSADYRADTKEEDILLKHS